MTQEEPSGQTPDYLMLARAAVVHEAHLRSKGFKTQAIMGPLGEDGRREYAAVHGYCRHDQHIKTVAIDWSIDEETPDALSITTHPGYDDCFQCEKPSVPIRRDTPKLGRNDLCSCGSGKKYKKCCLDSGPAR